MRRRAAALPAGDKVVTFQCAHGCAAGSMIHGSFAAAYLLQATNGTWVRATASSVCSSTSIPAAILAVSPCKVS
ncbi:MAG: hypothetical protein ACLQPH_21230 [Acidimicrobiales bacterium]